MRSRPAMMTGKPFSTARSRFVFVAFPIFGTGVLFASQDTGPASAAKRFMCTGHRCPARSIDAGRERERRLSRRIATFGAGAAIECEGHRRPSRSIEISLGTVAFARRTMWIEREGHACPTHMNAIAAGRLLFLTRRTSIVREGHRCPTRSTGFERDTIAFVPR